MEHPAYSILAMVEDTTRHRELYSELERDPHYSVRQSPPDLQAAEAAIGSKKWDLILIMTDRTPTNLKNSAVKLAVQAKIPVIFLCGEPLPAADPLVQLPLVQYLYDDGLTKAAAVVLKLGIRIRIAVTRAITSGHSGKSKELHESLSAPLEPASLKKSKLIAIGASMGGVEAVNRVLEDLPSEMPGIVVVQHMPKGFTDMYAKRLDSSCRLNVVQARDNQTVDAGTVYIAPGDFHMKIEKAPHGYVIRIMGGERVSGHRPSVNVLFRSVAAAAGKEALGIILTGMGEDGASGLLELRRTGADTIGQNAESSVVYGMPKVAYEIGAVCRQSALQDIPRHMIEYAYRH